MAEEALVAALWQWQVSPTDDDVKFWDERLRYLFDYAKAFDDASEWFDSRESDAKWCGQFQNSKYWIRRWGRVRFRWVSYIN